MKEQTPPIMIPPVLTKKLTTLAAKKEEDKIYNLKAEEEEMIKKNHPHSFTKDIISFDPQEAEDENLKKPITVAMLLSGGPAPGGHNVACGLYSALKSLNPESKLIGFREGFAGLLESRWIEITEEITKEYLNTGGFDMLGSSRVKITKEEEKQKCIEVLEKLNVKALVTIGGDDSNTNAAILAEYFVAKKAPIQVIGIPKTIDGDLKNSYVEQTFGFDTATTIFSSLIGNICRDAKSSRKYWHIIRLMGRDTGHICLECALQTHPNIAVIGEELKSKGISMRKVASEICDSIIKRSNEYHENFGVVLLSEGIIENCSDVYGMILEIDELKKNNMEHYNKLPSDHERADFLEKKMSDKENAALFASMSHRMRCQFMMDKDPHGHFQVALIDAEQLLIHMIRMELKNRDHKVFNPINHFFGYEGRCGWPTKFDVDYCFSLGLTGMMLIAHGATGYMACVRNLAHPVDKWIPCGIPLSLMMNTSAGDPRIKAIKVDLNDGPFKEYEKLRGEWKLNSNYLFPLPQQLYSKEEFQNRRTKTLALEKKGTL